MKQSSTMFLRLAVCVLGLAVLAVCAVVLPAGFRSEDWAGYEPIFVGMYVAAIPFFFALHQTFKLLGYVDTNTAFSETSVTALKYVKYCGYTISGLYAAGMPYIFHIADREDAPGAIILGAAVVGTSFVIATSAAVLQKLLKSAVDIKSENDLTV
jgi:hypothetical protein